MEKQITKATSIQSTWTIPSNPETETSGQLHIPNQPGRIKPRSHVGGPHILVLLKPSALGSAKVGSLGRVTCRV